MKKSFGKRILSLVLALTMIVTLIPSSLIRVEAATGDLLAAAIFASDVHGSTSDTTSVFSGIKTSGITYNTIGFVGDTDANPSTITSA